MFKRRLLLPLVAAIALLAGVPALASVYQPASTDHIVSAEANGGAVLAVERRCTGLGSQVVVLRAGSAPTTIVSCVKRAFLSEPSLTVDHADGWLVVVWAQATVLAKGSQSKAKLYAAISHNGGRSFGKPQFLHTIGGSFPAKVAAAAYAHRLWVLTAGLGQHKFSLQQFDLRFHQGLPPVKGLTNYQVLPSTSAFRIYAARDGVVALWEAVSGNSISWYAADTERIDPTDMTKAVRFVPRGKIASESLARLFVGGDGMLYRLRQDVDSSTPSNLQLKLSLDRWYFKTHKFAPVGANDGELKEIPDSSMSHSPVAAAGVAPDGTVELLLAPITPTQTQCLYNDILPCMVSDTSAGSPFELDRRDRNGHWTSKPVSLPAPAAGENAAAIIPFGSLNSANLVVTATGKALVDVVYAKATRSSSYLYTYPYSGARHSLELVG